MQRNHLLLIACFTLLLTSCSIEKRVYQSGYYISGRHSSNQDLDNTKRVKPIFNEETVSPEKASDEVDMATVEYSTPTKTLNYSDSIIDENISSNISQNNTNLTKSVSDSIPDEGKILLDKYEKNCVLREKTGKILLYPVVLLICAFAVFSLLFFLWLFNLIYDSILFGILLICGGSIVIIIPLFIFLIIISSITNKQSRALKKMGLIN